MHAGAESAPALDIIEEIAHAASPEEAARIGRRNERLQPSLMRTDWPTAKLAFMHAGLKAKVHTRFQCCIRVLRSGQNIHELHVQMQKQAVCLRTKVLAPGL